MSGWAEADLAGRKIYNFLSPEAINQHAGFVTRQLREGRAASIRLTTQRFDGSSFLVDVTITVLETREGDRYFIGLLSKVGDSSTNPTSDFRVASRGTRHDDRLVRLGQAATEISGDFINVMSVILDRAAGLEASITDSAGLANLRELQQSVAAAAGLSQQIVNYARVASSRAEPTDVNEVVWTSAETLAQAVGDDIVVRLDLALAPLWVMVDRRELDQALLCMAVNAREAMPEGGDLTIATGSEPHAGGADYPPAVRLSMTDGRRDISAQAVAQAFLPSSTANAGTGGRPIGLAAVREFAEHNLGTVELHSVVGGGTSVRLVLPALDALARFDRPG
ncbi:MAG: PAS domain S-box protein [Acidimicrobiia bacterium]|nr:PAS domain S-box protein [Acidimicrobiia bacterium]